MSEFFPCWILKPIFFSLFFKNILPHELLAAALTGFPPKRLVSILWYPGSLYEGGFCLQVRPDNRASFILELVPVFFPVSFPLPSLKVRPKMPLLQFHAEISFKSFSLFRKPINKTLFSMEISTPPLCPFPAVSSIFLPSSPLFLPFRISMPFPVSFWSAIPPNCLPSPGVFPPSLLSRRSWKKFSGNRSFEPYLQKHLIFPRKLPAESLPCVPSTGCCSAKNASMNSRRSPMIRSSAKFIPGVSGKGIFR